MDQMLQGNLPCWHRQKDDEKEEEEEEEEADEKQDESICDCAC